VSIKNLSDFHKVVHAPAIRQNDAGIIRSFIRIIVEFLIYEYKTNGFMQSLRGFVTTIRGMAYLKKNSDLFSLPLIRRYIAIPDDVNQLFHVRHRYYLCMDFNLCARIDSALSHYRFENDFHNEKYKELVYRDGGLVLWSAFFNGTYYEIRLRGSNKDRHEGGTSIVMLVDGTICLTEISYAWVDAGLVNAGSGIVPFITRNQSVRYDTAEMQAFRAHFPQHSPHYFCLAAMQGIAMAHGYKKIAAIKHSCQISFKQQYAESFRRSYSRLWKSFGAQDIGSNAYLMHAPFALRPLDQISSKHRKRAAMRRQQWAIITDCASASIHPHIIEKMRMRN